MHLEKRLNIRLALEDISILESEADLESSIQSEPDRGTYRAVIDAIKKFLGMSPRDLYQFATEGGSIEENLVVIESLTPQAILEQEVRRVVQTGNYYKVLEIRMAGVNMEYKGFIVAKLSMPNERIAKALQARMAGWKPGQPVPFDWYKTEAEALKAMSAVESKAAGKAPSPAQPIKQKVSKTPVNEVASRMAEHMGNETAATEMLNSSSENIIKYADLGLKTKKDTSNWKMVKTIFLAWLALSALVTGAAGLAALVIGYLAVKGYEATKGIKENLDDKDEFAKGTPCWYHDCHNRPDADEFHAAHSEVDAEARKDYGHLSVGRHIGINNRPWGVDPEEWMQLVDRIMGKHGYTRDMSSGKIQWVKSLPE